MGLSELMRMIIIFVTFCLNKKKLMTNKNLLYKKINKIKFKKKVGLCIEKLCGLYVML